MAKLWQKNYTLDSMMEHFTVRNDYIYDQELVLSDLIGSAAHAKGLGRIGILSGDEVSSLLSGLEEIAEAIQPQFEENDLETITTIVSRYQEQDTWKTDLIFTEESYDLLLDILESAGQLEERPQYDLLVDTSFAEKAAK